MTTTTREEIRRISENALMMALITIERKLVVLEKIQANNVDSQEIATLLACLETTLHMMR